MRLFVLAGLLLPGLSSAWGDVGHRVVCEIAFQELNERARGTVTQLLRGDAEYRTFSAACNWPDQPRKRDIEHYVNVPRSQQAIAVAECPLAEACLFSAIETDYRLLAAPAAGDAARLAALKYLGHWVGDIHQPMHVSFQDDRGGNSIELSGSLCEGSLHFAWDVCIIRESLGNDARAIARRLHEEVDDADRARWQFDSPAEWADESLQLATAVNAEYCTRRSGACWYAVDNMLLQSGEGRRSVVLDRDYVATHKVTVERRLQQAGIRLAALLNAALGTPGATQ